MKPKKIAALLLLILLGGCLNGHSDTTSSNSVSTAKADFDLEKSDFSCPDCNVILILVDTLRADHLGVYGYGRNTSPNIDKLAEEGILFKNMVAQSSWTKPATASILTGLYPKNHGANTRNDKLASDKLLLSEILKEKGYNTSAFVANGNVVKTTGFDQGYDKFVYFKENSSRIDIHKRSNEINKEVIPFIKSLKHKSKNFIYIHYLDPHDPYIPKEKYFSVSNKILFSAEFFKNGTFYSFDEEQQPEVLREMSNAYDDEILFNDKMIGNVIQTLKDTGMDDNSIIIISSDHGEEFFDHGRFKHGQTLYDEQLLVPLIIRMPSRIHKIIEKQVNQVDILPTILALLDIPSPKNIDGGNVFENERNEYGYAELRLDGGEYSSMRTLEKKLIIGSTEFESEEGFRWFKNTANVEFEGDYFEMYIASFYEDKSIQLLVDGDVVKQSTITPIKQIINHTFPNPKKRNITIKSLDPCKRPIDTGTNKGRRCLNFRIFNSSNFNISLTREVGFTKEYFSLENDPKEQNNLYYNATSREDLLELEDKLKRYLADKGEAPDRRPLNFDKEQLEALKALGYMN